MLHWKVPWSETTLIAIDLETTGKYPLDAEICEMAAVKWKKGKVVDVFQSLIKPTATMSQEVIAIHNITNEMVGTAPTLSEKIAEFHKFVSDGWILAHHAPFDMGFLGWEFERARLPLPTNPVLCTSLISRSTVLGVSNHRLQTLAKYYAIEAGKAHRAFDDAKTCLEVALKCFQTIGESCHIHRLLEVQSRLLHWAHFSIEYLIEKEVYRLLVRATLDKREVYLTYDGGSRPGQIRRVFPLGIVRNPDGDFLVATEGDEVQTKRYFLEKVAGARLVADGEF